MILNFKVAITLTFQNLKCTALNFYYLNQKNKKKVFMELVSFFDRVPFKYFFNTYIYYLETLHSSNYNRFSLLKTRFLH